MSTPRSWRLRAALRHVATGVCALACVVLIAACGTTKHATKNSTAAHPRGTITVYSGQHEQTTALLVKGFEKQTGVKVKVRFDDEAVLATQMLQEGSRSPADVFFTENTPVLEELQAHGALAAIPAATLAHVAARYRSTTGHWIGISARVDALVYNTAQVKPAALPRSILDLAKPAWKGKLDYAPSETDFQPLVSAITALDGAATATKWLRGLKANGNIYPDNETVVAKVNGGRGEVGIVNHYYWYRLRDEVGAKALHSALHYYAPGDVGNLIDVSGAAVLKSSSNPGAAQAFVAFLVSRKGQEILAHSESYEYPIGSHTPVFKPLRPLSTLVPPSVSLSQLGNGSAALALEQKVGLV